MIGELLIGSGMVALTTAIHAVAMFGAVRLAGFPGKLEKIRRSMRTRTIAVTIVVIVMFLASLIEAEAWALLYLWRGALDDLEASMYFSLVTYTTLGYGDITLDVGHRMLAAFQAANGIMMFGWTTAIIVAVVQRVYGENRPVNLE